MSVNIARELATAGGIPEEHLSAVEERVFVARKAVEMCARFRPMGRGDEILVRRVVACAVADHRAGRLERLV